MYIIKKYFFLILVLPFFANCSKMNDNIEKYAGEIVYPAGYDTIIGNVGFERVELKLLKAGIIPSKNINLGNARKTLIEYDSIKLTLDSLVSVISIPDLKLPKLYRFKVYTLDQYGNKSVPQEIALIPYTKDDLSNLTFSLPQVLTSPTSAVLSWPSGLSSILLDYYGLKFSYKDKDGVEHTGESADNPRIFMNNLKPGEPANIDITYKVVPKVNGAPIIDTLEATRSIPISLPTSSSIFSPAEQAILEANGIHTFTSDAIQSVDKLVFPVDVGTLRDLFYFPGLKEVDLTGGTLFPMKEIHYNNGGIVKTLGGGTFLPFAANVEKMTLDKVQFLLDLLDQGSLSKVKYYPNSLGIDDWLLEHDTRGVVEFVTLPDEILIPLDRFFIDGLVQSTAWRMNLEIPAVTYPTGTGLQNVIKTTLADRSASFAIIIPKEYRFNVQQYRHLRFKVYTPEKAAFAGIYAPYQRLWPRVMNYMWAFPGESAYGQEYWAPNADSYKIADADLQKWIDIDLDLSPALNLHNRVFVINIGGEPSLTFGTPPIPLTYYLSNFRFTKD